MNRFYPLVSIIIPVYNGANYLREAIESALAQTYKNIEVIVVNDGSNDNGETERIALSYGDNIRYFSKENGGVASALNLGIEKMKGEYFSWLSHDDLYMPEKIEKQISFILNRNLTDKVVFSGYTTINAKGEKIKDYHLPKNVYENVACLIGLDTTYTLNGCTLLIPKSLFKRCGNFDIRLKYTQDYDMWQRLLEITDFIYIDECLVLSRQHSEQGGRTGGNAVTKEADEFHTRAVSKLKPEDVHGYIEGQISVLRNLYQIYRNSGYIGTSIAILRLFAQYNWMFVKDQSNDDFLIDELKICRPLCKGFTFFIDPNEIRPVLTIYSNVWTFGGIERVMANLINLLQKKYKVILISNYVKDEQGYALPEDVTHIIIENKDLALDYQVAAIAYLMGTNIFIGNPNIILEFLPIYGLLSLLNIKSIMLNHYYYFLPYEIEWLHNIAEMRHKAISEANVALWLTNFSALMCACKHDNVAVMPNPNTFPEQPSRDFPQKKIVLSVGRFYDTIKRIDKTLRIFKLVLTKVPDAKLVLVGGYDMKTIFSNPTNSTLAELLYELDFPEGSISFEGEQKEVGQYYRKASVLLTTSEYEGFGMTLIEAGVFGVPVVAYRTPGLEDIISDGENGYLIAQDDETLAAERITELLTDRKKWLRMSRQAQILVKRFDPDVIIDRWERLFALLSEDSERSIGERLKEAGLSPQKTSDFVYLKDAVTEYEKLLSKKQIKINADNGSSSILPIEINAINDIYTDNIIPDDDELYRREVFLMRQSLSWRITYPIRLMEKVIATYKIYGLRYTLSKIYKKIWHSK